MKRPNVILLITDDQGYGDLGCYGNPDLRTPNLDRLHAESIRLADYHVDPMCSPTRAALMTGRYSARTGVWSTLRGRYMLRRDEVTMSDVFAASGYRTGLFGKWHLGDTYPYRPHDRGFQEALTFGGGVVGEIPDHWDNDYFTAVYRRNGKPERFSRYCTDVWFDEAIKFIEADRNKPFFCYLTTNAPHGPFQVHDRYSKPYEQAGIPAQRAKFYGMIANIDENLGKLRKRLQKLGLEENTILIFMGDNGTAAGVGLDREGFPRNGFNAGMRGKKCWAYEGGHRNACFIRWPDGKIDGGRDVQPITAHLDILPTLIDLCGLTAPKGVSFDGASVAPLLRGKTGGWPQRTLVVHNQQVDTPVKRKDFAVMTDRWRLVETKQWGPGRRELFDIQADPGQKTDVADRHPETVAELLKAYDRWWDDISRRFDEVSETLIGSDHQNPTVLTAHSWHGEKGIYSQRHVRPAVQDNGYWAIKIERDGAYEFALRRWPVEVDAPIRSSLPGRTGVPFVDDLLPGKAIPVAQARLKVADFDETKPVRSKDKAAVFQVRLKAGKMRLQTWFTDEKGETRGAYYVYAKRTK